MKKIVLFVLLMTQLFTAHGQNMHAEYKKEVVDFIDCVKNRKKDKLADKISYPLSRYYPLPGIKNKQEFLKRYNEVFDDSLTKMIARSKVGKDWSEMGWRGIMFDDGDVWLDFDGKVLAVNYQSAIETKMRDELIRKEKATLHESIKDFKEPVLIMETKKYRIRVDDMGNEDYRYASWLLQNKMSDKPDVILQKGERIPEGSGGNHSYSFKNDGYVYNCRVNYLRGEHDAPATLTIEKGDKTILSQDAKIIGE